MSGFLRSTMKAVSTSSGTFEKMKSCTHRPVAPSPQSSAATVQMVESNGRDDVVDEMRPARAQEREEREREVPKRAR